MLVLYYYIEPHIIVVQYTYTVHAPPPMNSKNVGLTTTSELTSTITVKFLYSIGYCYTTIIYILEMSTTKFNPRSPHNLARFC